MSRSPGAAGMQDARTTEKLRDKHTLTTCGRGKPTTDTLSRLNALEQGTGNNSNVPNNQLAASQQNDRNSFNQRNQPAYRSGQNARQTNGKEQNLSINNKNNRETFPGSYQHHKDSTAGYRRDDPTYANDNNNENYPTTSANRNKRYSNESNGSYKDNYSNNGPIRHSNEQDPAYGEHYNSQNQNQQQQQKQYRDSIDNRMDSNKNVGFIPSGQQPGQGALSGERVLEEGDVPNDSQRAWAFCFASFLIIMMVVGVIHSYYVFIPSLIVYYTLGFVEVIVIGVCTYCILIMFTPVASILVKTLGNRTISTFGMLLVFFGFFIESFCLFRYVFYINHLLFIAFGGSMALTAAMSNSADYFDKHLLYAVIFIVTAASVGTIVFYFLVDFFIVHIGFRWTCMAIALLFLIGVGICCIFPRKLICEEKVLLLRKDFIKECIHSKASAQRALRDKCWVNECGEAKRNRCLCVLVLDVSVWADMAFFIWGIISMLAIMSFYFPYLYLIEYAIDIGVFDNITSRILTETPQAAADDKQFALALEAVEKPLTLQMLSLILIFCLVSILLRIIILFGNDFTYLYNRTVFQVACLVSGLFYIFMIYMDTYGWLVVWCIVMGACEGILVVIIPRLTLLTIPKRWMPAAWTWLIILHALGILFAPILIIFVKSCTGQYFLGFIVIGICQIIAAILAFILPYEIYVKTQNENAEYTSIVAAEEAEIENENKIALKMLEGGGKPGKRRRRHKSKSRQRSNWRGEEYERSFSRSRSNMREEEADYDGEVPSNRRSTAGPYTSFDGGRNSNLDSPSDFQRRSGSLINNPYAVQFGLLRPGRSVINPYTGTYTTTTGNNNCLTMLNSNKTYQNNCPICSRIGCIPGCCPDCLPGSLSGYNATTPTTNTSND